MEQHGLVYVSTVMQSVVETALRVSSTPSPVLIEGESGTGKELVAGLIHRRSRRNRMPLVAINCGAIPETLFESEFFGHRAGSFTGAVRDHAGIFEAARGGTLFLDEVGDLPRPMQAKCLRALQEGEVRRVGDTRPVKVDVRLISATNRNLEADMRRGLFRQDLFFRIGVIRIEIPPLRDRPEDVPALARHLAWKHARRLGRRVPGFGAGALETLCRYSWPGNVRELENEVHRLVVLSTDHRPVDRSLLSERIVRGGWPDHAVEGRLRNRLRSFERQIIKEALERYGWNKTRVARHLGLTRQGLYRKLQRLGLDRAESD
jgi:transcriptional regulator with PAS, ATPase and Fis domain